MGKGGRKSEKEGERRGTVDKRGEKGKESKEGGGRKGSI